MDIPGACLHPFAGFLRPGSLLASPRKHHHGKEARVFPVFGSVYFSS